MKVSRVPSGRLILILSKEERSHLKGPYRVGIGFNWKEITIISDEEGHKGSRDDRGGGWKIEWNTAEVGRLPYFGQVQVPTEKPPGQLCFLLPDDLPDPISRKKRRTVPPVIAAPAAEPLAWKLPELVRRINEIRCDCPDNMVFSTDDEGYLRVTVEYGRA